MEIENYTYTRDKLNYHIQSIQYSKPSVNYGLIELIHPVTSLFIKNIADYEFNNEINLDHVNKIYKGIMEDEDKMIIGHFSVVQCEDDNKLYLIDGHHRKQALLKIMNENSDNVYLDSIYIEVKIYHVKTLKCDATYKLYERINNVKPYMIKTLDDTIRYIMDKLEGYTHFYKGFKTYSNNNAKGSFPYYNKNKFINQLKKKLELKTDINADIIVEHIINFNKHCNTLSITELFKITQVKYNNNKTLYDKKYERMLNIGTDIGFFLRSPYGELWHIYI